MAQLDLPNKDELQQHLKDLESSLILKLKEVMKMKEPEEFLTRNDVADLLKINVNTLDRWSKNGKLKRYGIGDRIFYKRSEVEESITRLK